MADPLVIHQDIVLYLTTWYRAALAARPEQICHDVVVDVQETDDPKQVIIRDDGGTDTSLITNERSIGISILAGSKENPKDANDLAAIVHALRLAIPSTDPSNPVAAVLESSSPLPVAEAQPHARRYIALVLSIVGSPL